MAQVTASMVKELREMTGAGMMDCKKALDAVGGDMDAAVEELRKNGLAKAAKKAGRVAAEGLVGVLISDDGKKAAIVEVNSETDFAAKNDLFRNYVKSVLTQVINSKATTMEAFMEEPWNEDASFTVATALAQKISVIGENINIRRFDRIETDGVVGCYVHHDDRKAAIIDIACDKVTDGIKTMGLNLGMQIVSMRPEYLNDASVPAEFLAHEKEIIMEQAKQDESFAKKPANIQENIIAGRVAKELKEICLMDQVFFMDEEGKSVTKYVESVSKAEGTPISIRRFVRFETGEGIEKKEENFAEEVAKQMK